MMEFIRNWIVSLVATGVVVSVAYLLTPPGTAKRVVQMGGGLILLLAVVRPLLSAPWQSLSLTDNSFQTRTEQYSKSSAQAGGSVMKKLIEEKTSAYIENEAQARGLAAKAKVTAQAPSEGEQPVPWQVRITAGEADEKDREAFSQWIGHTLGIPLSRQLWDIRG